MAKTIFKNDKFKSARGASRMLQIMCTSCNTKIIRYQKDGPGELKRMYLDRIHEPAEYQELRFQDISKLSDLHCPACHKKLGIITIYEKETRKAYQLFQGSVSKQIIKL